MIVIPKTGDVMYVAGASAKDVWDQALEREIMGTGHTRKSLRKLGWRAMKVRGILQFYGARC